MTDLSRLLKVGRTQRVPHEVVIVIFWRRYLHQSGRRLLLLLKLLNIAIQPFLKCILRFRARFPIRFGLWTEILRFRWAGVNVFLIWRYCWCMPQIISWSCLLYLLLTRVSLSWLLRAYALRFVLLKSHISVIPPLLLLIQIFLILFDALNQLRADLQSSLSSRRSLLEVSWSIKFELKSWFFGLFEFRWFLHFLILFLNWMILAFQCYFATLFCKFK